MVRITVVALGANKPSKDDLPTDDLNNLILPARHRSRGSHGNEGDELFSRPEPAAAGIPFPHPKSGQKKHDVQPSQDLSTMGLSMGPRGPFVSQGRGTLPALQVLPGFLQISGSAVR
jgi:hypothetical protein